VLRSGESRNRIGVISTPQPLFPAKAGTQHIITDPVQGLDPRFRGEERRGMETATGSYAVAAETVLVDIDAEARTVQDSGEAVVDADRPLGHVGGEPRMGEGQRPVDPR